MAVISTITIGSEDYSVYALTADPLADADDYLAAKIGSTWSTATDLQKQQALISAARFMDRAVIWSGDKTVASQPREWPKDGAVDGCNGGEAVPDGTTPDAIALGEFELADALFLDATIQASTGTGSNVKKVKAGSAEVVFFTGTSGTSDETRLPTQVNDLVSCFIEGSEVAGGSFGTDDDDADPGYCQDDFDLSQGYP
jgi:hypothetical protein